MAEAFHSVPEIGDLVQVRSRRWIVTGIKPTPFTQETSCQHRVDLSSIEEDSRSETANVIWEVEPEATIEKSALPEVKAFDDYAVFSSFLNAIKWGGLRLTFSQT